MTRDGIIQDVSETKRRLMSGDFTPKQSETLIGFVNEQIKDYCHSKVDQRRFENWLKDDLEFRFNSLTTIFHTKEDQRIFEQKTNEKFKTFHTKVDQRRFENWLKDDLEFRFNSLSTIFHTKEDQRIFEAKMDERFERLESRMDKFEENMEQQTLAIIGLTQAINKRGGTL